MTNTKILSLFSSKEVILIHQKIILTYLNIKFRADKLTNFPLARLICVFVVLHFAAITSTLRLNELRKRNIAATEK